MPITEHCPGPYSGVESRDCDVSLHCDVGIGQKLPVEGRLGARPGKGNPLREKEKEMKKQIGIVALAVLTAFTIGFAPALAVASQGNTPVYEGTHNFPGIVEMSNGHYILKSPEGTFRLTGKNASSLVGKDVKAWGVLTRNSADVETLNVWQFEPIG
jgi:predicted small secreted protein